MHDVPYAHIYSGLSVYVHLTSKVTRAQSQMNYRSAKNRTLG